jgi:hypothetical protein
MTNTKTIKNTHIGLKLGPIIEFHMQKLSFGILRP